ncbi:hypothetical protein J3R82DRAFT_3846, partial [Butyriboletus roseoflavus]
AAHLMKEWVSSVYTFFVAKPSIINVNSWYAHDFQCSVYGCKARIRHFIDTQDIQSTSNLCKHVKTCCGWGPTILSTADQAKDADEVCIKIIKTFTHDGSIITVFKRKENGKVTYSNLPHT